MTIHSEDLVTFSKIGKAFWADSKHSENLALETLSAVSSLDIRPDRAIEKASTALLARARNRRLNSLNNLNALNSRFYRLNPEERLILVTLHQGKWSYARLSRVLQKEQEIIEEIAWSARVQLAAGVYPSGAPNLGPYCPEYLSQRPWTQRFLDNEISSPRDLIFLQNHLLICEPCAKTLARGRELYFQVDQEIAKALGDFVSVQNWEKILNRDPKASLAGFLSFLKRPDIFWAVMVLVVLFVLKWSVL